MVAGEEWLVVRSDGQGRGGVPSTRFGRLRAKFEGFQNDQSMRLLYPTSVASPEALMITTY